MNKEGSIVIDGAVAQPTVFDYESLSNVDARYQIVDVSQSVANREGDAVRLKGLLERVQPVPGADYLGLHSSSDDFHASIPLSAVQDRGFLIYRVEGQPLSARQGGPFRFFIPDHAACQAHEIDECANVKFVDRIELTIGKGFDNRPTDEEDHARLHEKS